MSKLVLRIDEECGSMSPWGLYKSKEQLRESLHEQSAYGSWDEEEYKKLNAHVDLEEYCDLFQCGYIEFTEEQIEESLGDYAKKHKLKDNWGEEL
tara:strand:- start:251 stop:535 length:285 start_codon:yes stop_codon:yes gene_type:complete